MLSEKTIEEIWILSKSGVTLFNQRADGKEDPAKAQFIGGMFSAINTISEEMNAGGFNSMAVGMKRLSIVKDREHELFFVGMADAGVKEQKVVNAMIQLKAFFVDCFKKELASGDCEVSVFEQARDAISLKVKDLLGVSLNQKQSKRVLDML